MIDGVTGTTILSIYTFVAGLVGNVLKPLMLGRGVDVPMPVIPRRNDHERHSRSVHRPGHSRHWLRAILAMGRHCALRDRARENIVRRRQPSCQLESRSGRFSLITSMTAPVMTAVETPNMSTPLAPSMGPSSRHESSITMSP